MQRAISKTTGASSTSTNLMKPHVPVIACFNRSTGSMGIEFDVLIAALQRFIDEHVAPVWGTPAKLIKTTSFVRGCWALVFLDHADHAKALAYHDLTPEGLPQSKVFVRTTLANRKPVSIASSHELVEMLVDPSVELVATKRGSKLAYGYEAADPVEDLSFPIDGIPMTNFVYPTYFESFHKPGSVPFDHLRQLKKPFQIHVGGYQGVLANGKWTQRFGSRAKQKLFAQEDRKGRRGEKRSATKLRRSSSKHPVHQNAK